VAALALESLRDLPGPPIPTLDEVLRRYGRRTRLFVEIKARRIDGGARAAALARQVVRRLVRLAPGRDVFLLCFDERVLEICREESPEVQTVLNLKPPRRWTRSVERRLHGLAALSVDVSTLGPAFAAGVHEAGLPLLVYTCNGPRELARALAARPRGIMSDRPAWLAHELARR
jgi:glycerophosphoryl diester phosphodiesterase